MPDLITHPTSTAEWHALVNEAECAAHCRLIEEMESYLVFLLMRFCREPGLASRVFALEYLDSTLAQGRARQDKLREVGDQCLLYSGLFPQQAQRKHVRAGYFADLGRAAYRQLSMLLAINSAASSPGTNAGLYARLSENFVALMDVLLVLRNPGGQAPQLGVLEAYDLWNDTGSRTALKAYQAATQRWPTAISSIPH